MKKIFFLSHFFLAIINCVLFSFSNYFDFYFSIELAVWISFSSVILILFQSFFAKYNFFSIINFFNGFALLFLYGNVINYFFFNINDFNYYHLFEGFDVPTSSFISSLYLINFGISIINSVYLKLNNKNSNYVIPNNRVPNYIIFVFILFSCLAIFKFYLEFKYIRSVGYVNFYLNGLGNVNYYSTIIKNSHTIFIAFYGLLISYLPKKKIFIFATLIFSIVSIFNGLKGARILILLPILFSLWFYYKHYSVKENKFFLKFVYIFCIFIALQAFKNIRSNQEINIDLENVISYSLAETGSTQKLIALYLKEKDNLESNYPYVLEPILYPLFYAVNTKVYKGGQSEELASKRNSFNHKFSFYLNPNYYLKGNGLGSSMIAESFQYGIFYFLLIMILFGYLIVIFERSTYKPLLIISPIIFNTLVFAPRESPFPNTWGILKIYAIVVSLYFVIYILRKNRIMSPSKIK